MEKHILKVINDGRITIPKETRERLDINEGDHVEVVVLRKINGEEA